MIVTYSLLSQIVHFYISVLTSIIQLTSLTSVSVILDFLATLCIGDLWKIYIGVERPGGEDLCSQYKINSDSETII